MSGFVKLDANFKNIPSLYKKRKSPNFKDVLRERCHNRIKAGRQALLDKFRHTCDQSEVKRVFCDIIHEEAQAIKNGSDMSMDVVDGGSVDCMAVPLDNLDERWLLEEYEKVSAEEEAQFSEEWHNQLICPVCERGALKQTTSIQPSPSPLISCASCRTVFPPVDSIRSLSNVINGCLDDHDSHCDEGLFFMVLSNPESSLYTFCDSCGQYNRVLNEGAVFTEIKNNSTMKPPWVNLGAFKLDDNFCNLLMDTVELNQFNSNLLG